MKWITGKIKKGGGGRNKPENVYSVYMGYRMSVTNNSRTVYFSTHHEWKYKDISLPFSVHIQEAGK